MSYLLHGFGIAAKYLFGSYIFPIARTARFSFEYAIEHATGGQHQAGQHQDPDKTSGTNGL